MSDLHTEAGDIRASVLTQPLARVSGGSTPDTRTEDVAAYLLVVACDGTTMWSSMLTTSELERLGSHAPHGTHARYNAEVRAGETPCEDCRDGEATYQRERRLARDKSAPSRSRNTHRPFTRRTHASVLLHDQEDEEDEEIDDEPEDDDELEDEDEFEDDEEEYEPDAAPSVRRSEVLAAPGFGPAWETMSRWNRPAGTIPRSRLATGSRSTIPGDPRARLRAITASLDARHPHGSEAVKLLVEAVPYLTGGVASLHQYGETRGCHPEDIAAAEKIVVGKGRGR